MSAFRTNRSWTSRVIAVGLLTSLTMAICGYAADPRYVKPAPHTIKKSPAQSDAERKAAEATRKIEQARRDIQSQQQRRREEDLKDLADAKSGHSRDSSASKFDPISAPPPNEVFHAFVSVARTATSMEQILPYLPHSQADMLKRRQAQHDQKIAAKNRDEFRKQAPNLTKDDLDHLASSPYAAALKWHKGVADSIIRVMNVKVDGARATLEVSAFRAATINGERYDYGTADVKMLGEGTTWKFTGFDPSILFYKEAP